MTRPPGEPSRQIFVTFQAPGFHRWPDASGAREYLKHRHRHLFHVRVDMDVDHDEREVEFHDLADFCRQTFINMGGSVRYGAGEYDDRSCETLARTLGDHVQDRWPSRALSVSVSEDGECGAILHFAPA